MACPCKAPTFGQILAILTFSSAVVSIALIVGSFSLGSWYPPQYDEDGSLSNGEKTIPSFVLFVGGVCGSNLTAGLFTLWLNSKNIETARNAGVAGRNTARVDPEASELNAASGAVPSLRPMSPVGR